MKSTKKCLIESNAVVEALGQGKQTIIIRNYKNILDGFLLYPNYRENGDNISDFKNECQSFVSENSDPKADCPAFEVRYYATVEEQFEKPATNIDTLRDYHLWSDEYLEEYINSDKTYVWLLRVYKLKQPVMSKRTSGMVYANTEEIVALDDLEVIISDGEFEEIKNSLQ